jgi:hypothetical protein
MRGTSYARGPMVGDCDAARFASPFFASTYGETLDREKQPIPHPTAPHLSPLAPPLTDALPQHACAERSTSQTADGDGPYGSAHERGWRRGEWRWRGGWRLSPSWSPLGGGCTQEPAAAGRTAAAAEEHAAEQRRPEGGAAGEGLGGGRRRGAAGEGLRMHFTGLFRGAPCPSALPPLPMAVVTISPL